MSKKILIILIVVVAIISLFYFSGLAERLATLTQPFEVEFDKWNLYIILNISCALFFSLLVFYIYSTFLCKLFRINNFQDVFRITQPWWWGFIIVIVITFLFSFLFGITFVPKKSLRLFLYIFILSVPVTLMGALFYWIFTLLYSPPKVKYIPPGRYRLVKVFKRYKGG